LLAISLVLTALHAAARADGVSVLVRLAAPDALEVNALPEACTALTFLKDGADGRKIRSRWLAQDDCGAASGDTLRRKPGACRAVRFRVPVTSDKVGGYPGSFPAGQAVYTHMSNYAVGRRMRPSALPPHRYRHCIRRLWPASNARPRLAPMRRPCCFPMRLASADLDYFDPALSAVAVAQIRSVADGTAAYLRRAMPHAAFKRPMIAAALAQRAGRAQHRRQCRRHPAAVAVQLARRACAPGAAHDEQTCRARNEPPLPACATPWTPMPDARLIHEGGAEFLRWSVSLRQGWLTPQQAAEELDDALAACMLATGERSWRTMSQREIGSWPARIQLRLARLCVRAGGAPGPGHAVRADR
jgi:hypothetical protein